jgi:hypothetical protein
MIEDKIGQAFDTNIRGGSTYAYTAQRVFRVGISGQTLELDGELSPEVRVSIPSGPQR